MSSNRQLKTKIKVMIKAVLIDDDSNLRSGMKGLLALFAPQIEIVGEADTVYSAVVVIEKAKPQLIF